MIISGCDAGAELINVMENHDLDSNWSARANGTADFVRVDFPTPRQRGSSMRRTIMIIVRTAVASAGGILAKPSGFCFGRRPIQVWGRTEVQHLSPMCLNS